MERPNTNRLMVDTRTDAKSGRRRVVHAVVVRNVHRRSWRQSLKLRYECATGVLVSHQNRIAANRARQRIGNKGRAEPGHGSRRRLIVEANTKRVRTQTSEEHHLATYPVGAD